VSADRPEILRITYGEIRPGDTLEEGVEVAGVAIDIRVVPHEVRFETIRGGWLRPATRIYASDDPVTVLRWPDRRWGKTEYRIP